MNIIIQYENEKMNSMKLFNKKASLDIDLLENENKYMNKESENFKEINEQIKKENDDLCEAIGNQNISMKEL